MPRNRVIPRPAPNLRVSALLRVDHVVLGHAEGIEAAIHGCPHHGRQAVVGASGIRAGVAMEVNDQERATPACATSTSLPPAAALSRAACSTIWVRAPSKRLGSACRPSAMDDRNSCRQATWKRNQPGANFGPGHEAGAG